MGGISTYCLPYSFAHSPQTPSFSCLGIHVAPRGRRTAGLVLEDRALDDLQPHEEVVLR